MKTSLVSWHTLAGPLRLMVRGVICIILPAVLIGGGFAYPQAQKSTKQPQAVTPPRWFTKIPSDESNLITKGRADSKDQQLAIDKAAMVAREETARYLEQQWSTLLVSIRSENSTLSVPDSGWGPFGLANSRIKRQAAVKSGKMWTAFVLVTVPRSSLHPLLLERLHQDDKWYSQVKNTKAVLKFEAAPPE